MRYIATVALLSSLVAAASSKVPEYEELKEVFPNDSVLVNPEQKAEFIKLPSIEKFTEELKSRMKKLGAIDVEDLYELNVKALLERFAELKKYAQEVQSFSYDKEFEKLVSLAENFKIQSSENLLEIVQNVRILEDLSAKVENFPAGSMSQGGFMAIYNNKKTVLTSLADTAKALRVALSREVKTLIVAKAQNATNITKPLIHQELVALAKYLSKYPSRQFPEFVDFVGKLEKQEDVVDFGTKCLNKWLNRTIIRNVKIVDDLIPELTNAIVDMKENAL
jgi:hypothetical protein